ncbi:MAG TPA: hypothetical protein VHR84_06875 [Terriglobales bacterium]|jgi:hypothetical protein|nr:hypothetical protein [Terriglobales bacterium]
MNLELETMAIAMPEVEGHPNRIGFHGLLTLVDVPSDRAPNGARGHRVLLPRKLAEQAIPSLLGMALDYAPTWDRHDVRRKVGVITSAEVVGNGLEVGGYLFAKVFPEIVEEVARSGKRPGRNARERSSSSQELGMSYEVTSVGILNRQEPVWVLTSATFTGAAILRRQKAAYRKTWIELEEQQGNTECEGRL